MNLKRLHFYFTRLKYASFTELLHRLSECFFLYRFKKNPDCYQNHIPKDLFKTIDMSSLKLPLLAVESGSAMSGVLTTLGYDAKQLQKFEAKWKTSFFTDVRQEAGDPDIRAVWEPGRLQHLIAEALTNKDQSSGVFQRCSAKNNTLNLLDWLEKTIFPYGVHFCSVMECGLRVPVFMYVLERSDNLPWENKEDIFRAIYQHCWLIDRRLSLYSSLGNHTVAESVGLIFGGGLFYQHCKLADTWIKKGIILLEQESKHQILADGGPAEQSFSYHRFVLDLYWLAIDFLEINKLYDCSRLKERVASGERFINVMKTEGEVAPRFGDSDDGYALGRGMFPALRLQYQSEENPGPVESFPDSGYTVFRDVSGSRLIFDHGPLGMAPLYNHGHADALSVVLSVGEIDFLVDPGTYQYNGDQGLRRYFKGTSAHNTVTIDGLDQAEQITGFIWDKPYRVEVDSGKCNTAGKRFVQACHDGYCRLAEPVRHIRRVLLEDDGLFLIKDSFTGVGNHVFELHFHIHPGVSVDRIENRVELYKDGTRVELEFNGGEISILEGSEEPLAGWYSPSYGVLQKTRTIRVVKEGTVDDAGFTTRIEVYKETSMNG